MAKGTVSAAEKQKYQRQTPSLKGTNDPFEEQPTEEFEDKSPHVGRDAESLGKVQDEGKEQEKFNSGKGEEHGKSGEGERAETGSLKQARNSPETVQRPQVLKWERGTKSSEMAKAKGRDDDKVITGEGEEVERSADGTMGDAPMGDATSINPEVEIVQQPQVLKWERGTKSSEMVNAKGREDDKVITGEGEEVERSADGTMGDAPMGNAKSINPEVENVQQPQVLKWERGTKSSEMVNAKGRDDDKVNAAGKREKLELSAEDNVAETMGGAERSANSPNVEKVQSEKVKAKKGRERSADDTSMDEILGDAESVKRSQGDFGTIRQRVLGMGRASNRSVADDEQQGGKETSFIMGKEENNEVDKSDNERAPHEMSDSSGIEGKRETSERFLLPVRPLGRYIPSGEDDRKRDLTATPSGAPSSAASIFRQAQGYRTEMAAWNLLMHSAPPSYLSGGLRLPPPAAPNYPPYYQPAYPPSYFHLAPLPHHQFYHHLPHAPLYYGLEQFEREQEHRRRAHGDEGARLHHLHPRTHIVPTTSDAALRSRPATEEALRAVVESRRVGLSSVPTQRLSNSVLSSPSSSIEAQSSEATPRSLREATAASASLKTANFEMPTADPSAMDEATLERVRRQRKNVQSRLRTARLRQQLEEIKAKPPERWTAEEQRLMRDNEKKRQKKNMRSRSRAMETKREIDRILSIPEDMRTEKDIEYYTLVMGQKKRKIEGDKLRRTRVKELGLPPGLKAPGIPARGPLPHELKYKAEEEDQAKKHFQDPHDEA